MQSQHQVFGETAESHNKECEVGWTEMEVCGIQLTGGWTVRRRLSSEMVLISDRSNGRKEGYNMHHTSVVGRRLAADAMNADAPVHEKSHIQPQRVNIVTYLDESRRWDDTRSQS